MSPHLLHSDLMHLRLAEIEAGAERHRRESSYSARATQIARSVRSLRPALRLRPAVRHA
jgi:hypothetical protein